MRILVVEDDARTRDLICRGLRECDHAVVGVGEGRSALELLNTLTVDILVLDLGLPEMDGYQVAAEIRKRQEPIPILMLTARDQEEDVVRGLELGADDYLIKPFSFRELVARLERIVRRSAGNASGTARRFSLDTAHLCARMPKMSIPLTRAEFNLLAALYENAGTCVSRAELVRRVWGESGRGGANHLDVLIHALRAKLRQGSAAEMLETVRGEGYRFCMPREEERVQAGEGTR